MFKDYSQDSFYAWFRLFITLIIGSSLNIGMWAIVIALPDIQSDLDYNRAEVSSLVAFTMLGFALGNFLLGRLVDLYGISFTLILSALITLGGFFVSSTTNSFTVLGVCHIMIGLGTAAGFGPLMSDISFWFSKNRGIAVSVAASGNYLSGIVWPFLIRIAVDDSGDWRSQYVFFGIIAVGFTIPSALLLFRKIDQKFIEKDRQQAELNLSGKVISPKVLISILLLASFSCCVAMSMPQIHIVALCVDLGFGPLVGTNMLSLMLIGGIFSRIFSGIAVDYFGGLKVLLIGSGLQCLALFLFLPFDRLVPLHTVSLIFGLAQGGIVPSYAVIIREFLPPKNAASKVGIILMATIFGMAFGSWLSGYIYDQTGSYQLAFWNGIIWNILNLALVLFIVSRGNRKLYFSVAN